MSPRLGGWRLTSGLWGQVIYWDALRGQGEQPQVWLSRGGGCSPDAGIFQTTIQSILQSPPP